MKVPLSLAVLAAMLLLTACQSTSPPPPALPTAQSVDLRRFMGSWYVIGNIPTWVERGAANAVETYTLRADGTVDIHFDYRADSPDGKAKTIDSRGFVSAADPAIWGVQFFWPLKADYRIAEVSPRYDQTIIAREKRDNVWIMARTPTISESDYQRLLARVGELGYDVSKVQRVPQRWN